MSRMISETSKTPIMPSPVVMLQHELKSIRISNIFLQLSILLLIFLDQTTSSYCASMLSFSIFDLSSL